MVPFSAFTNLQNYEAGGKIEGGAEKVQDFTEQSSYHSIASSSPSPFIAEVLKMAHVLFLRAERPRALDISDGVMAPSMSFEIQSREKT